MECTWNQLMELYLSECNYWIYKYKNTSRRCKYKVNNNKNIKDIRRKGRRGIFDSNMIGHWYIIELIQKRHMHGGNKKDNK